MKKILYLTIFPNPFQFEFTNAVKNILVDKIEFLTVYEKTPPEFRQHWGNFKNGYTLKPGQLLETYLNEAQPDILVFTMYNSKQTRNGIKWAKKNNKIYFLGPHEVLKGDDIHPLIKHLKLLRYKRVAKDARGIITMGNQAVRELSNLLPNHRAISIPYSFDLSKLMKFERKTKSDELVFLMSGRLYDFRNPLLGIRTFGKLVQANPKKKLKLIISGTGPLEDKCVELIENLNIKKNVEWMNPKFKDWYDIHNIYKHADVLLALQKYGTWGLIIQEAMAAGLGIISTNTIQAADTLIVNGYNGYLTTLNEKDILNCMQQYVNNLGLTNLHGSRNREIVKQLDVKVAAKKFVNFIQESK